MTALKLHRWNSLFLLLFIVMHFITHLSGVFGIAAYNNTQSTLRLIYRNQFIEPFVLLSAIIQIGCGAMLFFRRSRRGFRGPWAYVQAVSGGIFLLFLTQHLVAMIFTRWAIGLDTNFFWPASVMRGAPFIWYFFPYYFLGVSALFTHIGGAGRLILLRGVYRRYALTTFWVITLFGVSIALVINLILLGTFFDIHLPDEWLSYLRNFIADYRG